MFLKENKSKAVCLFWRGMKNVFNDPWGQRSVQDYLKASLSSLGFKPIISLHQAYRLAPLGLAPLKTP